MDVQEIAAGFVALCSDGKLDEAQRYWSDDVVSLEGFPGPSQACHGRAAVLEKQRMWSEGSTVHRIECDGPFIHGEQFATMFELDMTGQDGVRRVMREIALYTVQDGQIVEERFFPFTTHPEGR